VYFSHLCIFRTPILEVEKSRKIIYLCNFCIKKIVKIKSDIEMRM